MLRRSQWRLARFDVSGHCRLTTSLRDTDSTSPGGQTAEEVRGQGSKYRPHHDGKHRQAAEPVL